MSEPDWKRRFKVLSQDKTFSKLMDMLEEQVSVEKDRFFEMDDDNALAQNEQRLKAKHYMEMINLIKAKLLNASS